MSDFSECEPALDDGPIRQGDVISFHDGADPWERLGVIVTGDCDIARNKHAGRLTYIPVLTAPAYLSIIERRHAVGTLATLGRELSLIPPS